MPLNTQHWVTLVTAGEDITFNQLMENTGSSSVSWKIQVPVVVNSHVHSQMAEKSGTAATDRTSHCSLLHASRAYTHTHVYGNLTHIYILFFSSNTQEKFPATNTVDAPKIAAEHTMCWTFSSLSLESAHWEYNSVFRFVFLPSSHNEQIHKYNLPFLNH